MTKKEYIKTLQEEARALTNMIIELKKRRNQIHEMLEEALDSIYADKWEREDDNR